MNQETGNSAAIKRDKAKMQQQGYWFISDVFPTLHRSNRGKSNQHTTPHTGYCNRIQIKPLGKKKTTNPPSPSGIEGRRGGGGNGRWPAVAEDDDLEEGPPARRRHGWRRSRFDLLAALSSPSPSPRREAHEEFGGEAKKKKKRIEKSKGRRGWRIWCVIWDSWVRRAAFRFEGVKRWLRWPWCLKSVYPSACVLMSKLSLFTRFSHVHFPNCYMICFFKKISYNKQLY